MKATFTIIYLYKLLNITDLVMFKIKLKKYLLEKAYYSLEEYWKELEKYQAKNN